MADLTQDEIFELAEKEFSLAIGRLQSKINKKPDVYVAMISSGINVISYAVAALVISEFITKDKALEMTTKDIKKTVDKFIEAIKDEISQNLN